MCGIGGIYRHDGAAVERAVLERMVAALKHRGPDDSGVYAHANVGLAHTRLAVIDLSTQGHQPMLADDGRVALAYNGEVYNYRELRTCLRAHGHAFRGDSDTEVVLRAYLQWGVDAFARLDGMFALAMWDARVRQLHLARDQFGVKPLYYRRRPCSGASRSVLDGLVFASEIKAILATGDAPRQVDYRALHEYLFYGTALGERTMFEGVRKLQPGHVLTVDHRGVRCAPFTSIPALEDNPHNFATAVRTVRELLDDAVRRHLVADVPVGVFLSGGVDSAAITALASRHYHGKLMTMTAGFDDASVASELPAARRIAERFNTDHHEVHIRGENICDVIEQLVRCHDEPFGDPANVALFILARQARGTTVILQGDGGDEMFGGYRRHVLLTRLRMWRLVGRATAKLHGMLSLAGVDQSVEAALGALAEPQTAQAMARLIASESPDRPPPGVLSAGIRAQLARTDPFAHCRDMHKRFTECDAVRQLIQLDASVTLPDLFFEKVDKPTMHHGIEVRVPMVDRPLAAYAMNLPSAYRVRGRNRKIVLREALRGVLPDETLDDSKAGLNVPVGHWFRTSLADYAKAVLFDPATMRRGLFDREALADCMEEHLAGRRDNGQLLYKLLNLALWCHQYQPAFGAGAAAPPPRNHATKPRSFNRPALGAGAAAPPAASPSRSWAATAARPKKTRCLFFVSGLARGGAEGQLVWLANGLANRGWDVTVATYLPASTLSRRLELSENRLRVVSLNAGGGILRFAAVPRAFALIRRLRPDVLVGAMFHGMVTVRVLGRMLGVPVNVSWVHSDRHAWAREGVLRWTRGLADAVVVLSGRLAEGLMHKGMASPSRLHVVPNAVDERGFGDGPRRGEMRRRLGLPPNAFVWLAAGRLEMAKDYPNMLRAFTTLARQRPDAMLAIAGDGSERPRLRKMIAGLRLTGRVCLLGLRDDVPDTLAAADGFVLSSAQEGMPVVVLEAMAVGLPVVVTSVGALPDIIADGRTGIMVPPHDSAALAVGMARLMDMPTGARAAIATTARAQVLAQHTTDVVLTRWEALFARLLPGTRAGTPTRAAVAPGPLGESRAPASGPECSAAEWSRV